MTRARMTALQTILDILATEVVPGLDKVLIDHKTPLSDRHHRALDRCLRTVEEVKYELEVEDTD
jgi:hypothetical protein